MSDPANPVAAAESIGEEIVTDAKAFIAREKTDLVTDMEEAWAWAKAEVAKLEPAVQADLKAAINTAAQDALVTGSSGSMVTDTLTSLARSGASVLAQVDTDVVTAVVGLTTATPKASS